MTDGLIEPFFRVVVASRVGDAMGTPTEGLEPAEIKRRFGWVLAFEGDGTDDSLMASLLANALVTSQGRANADEWAAEWVAQRDAILAKRDKFFPSVLHTVEKLASGVLPRRAAFGNMPSTSSAMCIWPVGLVHAGDPRSAAQQAYRLAALIHVGEVDFCQDAAAAVAATIAAGVGRDAEFLDVVHEGLAELDPTSGAYLRGLVFEAVDMAESGNGYEAFRERYHETMRRQIFCDSRETVPAAFALAYLAEGEVSRAVEYGANFGRDTDTIASMAGALCAGTSIRSIPGEWLDILGDQALGTAHDLAARLADVARVVAQHKQQAATRLTELESSHTR